MPDKNTTPLLSPKFALALQFANEIHATQVRKSKPGIDSCVPYISHLMAVCGFVLEYGGNETQAIAALLHDAAEDCGGRPMLETVRVMFGDGVAEIVEACTDTFETPKPDWKPRKQTYLGALASKPGYVKLVSCADKLHNISHTLRDIEREGVENWTARMAKTKNNSAEKQCWYYLGCLESFSNGWDNPILDVFRGSVIELCAKVGTAPDKERVNKLAAKEGT